MRLLITGGSGFIGTNLVQFYFDKGVSLINVDWNPPLNSEQSVYWQQCNIMDRDALVNVFVEFAPTHVVHLAARTDTDEEDDIAEYLQNTEGTRNVLTAISTCPGIERVVITSSQFVCEAGYQPKHDRDYKPFTLYGQTKKLTEQYTREAGLTCAWSIIRPTTIWGPWSLRYRDVMFKVMKKGLYFHPAKRSVIRSYGYVGNVVWQIDRIFEIETEEMDRKVFYVGDMPFDIIDWVECVSKHLTGNKVGKLPTFLVHMIALVGDALTAVDLPFPITTGRFKSMTEDYIVPMEETVRVLGAAPFSMEEGVRIMIDWYNAGSEMIKAHEMKDVREKTIPRRIKDA